MLDYPTKPVRIIEPFGAGSGVDVIARPVGQKLAELWGQPVTVQNHPGEGSTAAPALVAKSRADGYTVLVHTSAQVYSAALSRNLPYDPLKDFIPVAPLTSQAYVLVAGESPGITALAELIAVAKAKPGELKFGSAGTGTGTHLGLEKFNLAAGIKALHVPGETTPAAIADAVAGRTAYMIAQSLPARISARAKEMGAPSCCRTYQASRKRASPASTSRSGMEYGCPLALLPEWWTSWQRTSHGL